MSIGNRSEDPKNLRDVNADYIKAYLAEYDRMKMYGLTDKAEAVAHELSLLGHEVAREFTEGLVVETATPDEPEKAVEPESAEKAVPEALETAVETPKRGRPSRKSAE